MRLSDLQNKDVVDITTGERLGSIIDIEISRHDGKINKIFIYEKKGIFGGIRSEEETIYWNNIKKIGTDVILVSKNT